MIKNSNIINVESLISNKKWLIVEAPIPKHFQQAFQQFGFSEKSVYPLFLGDET